ncbi:beta family protein [Janthinobacterium sp. RT4P48]|uniref:beta family protein n=1 Tax=Janthinobacterium sp. RT4P48 TaxID=3424188 RepID=UPI003F297597
MEINNYYTPFLKFKVNEVAGISAINSKLKEELTPFFDIARKDGMSRDEFEEIVKKCCRKAEKYLKEFPYIFLDSFDIPDAIATAGSPNCRVIIDEFAEFEYVPVLGLDRAANHNQAIFDAKAGYEIISDKVAIRFQPDEFASFDLIKDELLELIEDGGKVFSDWIFVFDCRVCLDSNRMKLATEIANFVSAAHKAIEIKKYIVVGSSIPAAITDIAKPSDESLVSRAELEIFHAAQSMVKDISLSLGDYTIVSPMYSELTIAPELLLSVTAPKVFYAYGNYHYIARGGRIKTGGYGQYDVIFEGIVSKSFYRKAPYSWGDNFIQERADGMRAKNVTPSTILKPTICAHIEYMARDYPK